MTFLTLVLILLLFLLIGIIVSLPRTRNQRRVHRYQVRSGHEKNEGMKLIEYSAEGCTIALDQRELLLVVALIQEGRDSFGCNTSSGKALDQLFSSASNLVDQARCGHHERDLVQQKICTVAEPTRSLQTAASNGKLGY